MTISTEYVQLMARYNRWMNERIYDCCASIDDTERKAERGAFFGSIHATLNHLIYGDRAWLDRFEGRPHPKDPRGEVADSFDELRVVRRALDARLVRWAGEVDSAWLESDFTFTSSIDAITRTRPAWVLVTHMFNHQTHHRGQVTTMLSQLGLDPGVTDLPWLPE